MTKHYLTFPLSLLAGGEKSMTLCLNNAIWYCLYYEYKRGCDRFNEEEIEDYEIIAEFAAKQLGVKFEDVNAAIGAGERIYNRHFEDVPLISIKATLVFEFRDCQKSDFEIASFLAFAALRSIIQDQGCKRVTDQYLLSRMSGNRTAAGELTPFVKRFSSRYKLDKIKKELQANWHLKYYAEKTRGFYVSFTLSLKQIGIIAVEKTTAYKMKKIDRERKEARRLAMIHMEHQPRNG